MADFNNLREQAKQWLSSMFIPKELSPEGVANTGVGAMGIGASALLTPGTMPLMYGLDKLLKTKAGKQIQTMLDATGPMGGGLDDLVVAGAKTAPAALGMVAPLVSNLGRLKPRGVPARPSEWFHSNLAEAIDKAWLAPGEPSDLLNVKQVKAWLNKLPGMGVKKEEIKHFSLADRLKMFEKDPNFGGKISKNELAELVDERMPNITRLGDRSNKYQEYTIPDGTNYDNQLLVSKDIPNSDIRPNSSFIEHIPNSMQDVHQTEQVHWPEVPYDRANVLQHIRTTDRVLPNGQKALYAEEVQSDWQQQHPETYPLIQNYEDLAQKYLYRKAADEGYDSVAWTPASPHIERYYGVKKPASPVENLHDLYEGNPNLYNQFETELELAENKFYTQLGKDYDNDPDLIDTNAEQRGVDDIRRTLQEKYLNIAKEQGIERPKIDQTFSGHEAFYNKRMADSATGMLKRMGGGEVTNTDLQPILSPDDAGAPHMIEPIDLILERYKNRNDPAEGFIQPNPVKSFKYDIRPEDKAAPGAQGWEAPMAGKTVPLWMLLSGFAFDQLRGDKK